MMTGVGVHYFIRRLPILIDGKLSSGSHLTSAGVVKSGPTDYLGSAPSTGSLLAMAWVAFTEPVNFNLGSYEYRVRTNSWLAPQSVGAPFVSTLVRRSRASKGSKKPTGTLCNYALTLRAIGAVS